MIKNLFETWRDLEKHEADHVWGCSLSSAEVFESWLEQPINKAIAQGYIQRCIHDRGWYWSIGQQKTSTKAIVCAKRDGHPYECDKEREACHEVLLTAYLKTLAAQRAIAANSTWKHFKGDQYKVVNSASWQDFAPTVATEFDALTDPYKLENDPKVHLWLGGIMKEPWNYYTSSNNEDYGNLIFYKGISGQWARKADDFLDLVGSEHPEEGLLRFIIYMGNLNE